MIDVELRCGCRIELEQESDDAGEYFVGSMVSPCEDHTQTWKED